MSILTKKEILTYIQEKKLEFEPELDGFQIQPNTIDLRIGWSFYVSEKWEINDKGRIAINASYLDAQQQKEYFKIIKLKPGQFFQILPGEFILISTLEKISLNSLNIIAILYARSSYTRKGLIIESGTIDIGYKGHLTIPIFNTSNQIINLHPGERVCQLVFYQTLSELTNEEATRHGLSEAKYNASTPYGLEARSDNQEETELISKGQLKELKEKYKIA